MEERELKLFSVYLVACGKDVKPFSADILMERRGTKVSYRQMLREQHPEEFMAWQALRRIHGVKDDE